MGHAAAEEAAWGIVGVPTLAVCPSKAGTPTHQVIYGGAGTNAHSDVGMGIDFVGLVWVPHTF
jgi:hypothetical protein